MKSHHTPAGQSREHGLLGSLPVGLYALCNVRCNHTAGGHDQVQAQSVNSRSKRVPTRVFIQMLREIIIKINNLSREATPRPNSEGSSDGCMGLRQLGSVASTWCYHGGAAIGICCYHMVLSRRCGNWAVLLSRGAITCTW
eukprot:jgi/Botrbrau1/7243/Bobra.0021s0026.1